MGAAPSPPHVPSELSVSKNLSLKATKHIKRSSTSLTIREVQIRPVMRYQLTLVRKAVVKRSTNSKCWRRRGGRDPPTPSMGMYIGTATMENSVEVP